ncbi:unnamed protein product [Protopolystoma xenopodis]|uniref:Helicase C-terminal domain-containing protein n=1 Tax=Protopolystoma xenopodis TaxID=117903 RepID=A0A448WQK9_9PLAT|nr:unnamed protein product [Protopolystoma xenopodis]
MTINLLSEDEELHNEASLGFSLETVGCSSRGKRDISSVKNNDHIEEVKSSKQLWWHSYYSDDFDWRVDVGGKLDCLFRILRKCADIDDKVLVFTQSLMSLDLIEKFLREMHRQWLIHEGEVPEPKINDESEEDTRNRPDLSQYFSDLGYNSWIKGKDYERMDGSMNASTRKELQSRFNSVCNRRLRLFLISTRAGGLGINLVSANRLIMFDVSWNPSNDIQSIFRSYRFGQTKPVYIYRLIAQGTMEEKMYDRQVRSISLAWSSTIKFISVCSSHLQPPTIFLN